MDNLIRVFIKIDERNIVIEINSEIFLDDITGFIEIDQGTGDKYAHAQNNYFDKPLIDTKGRYNYKYQDGSIVEINEAEKQTMFPDSKQEPTEIEQLKEEQERTAQAVQDLILTMIGE